MNKTIITILIGGALIIGAFFLSSSKDTSQSIMSTPQAIAAEITVDRSEHDFGSIDIFAGNVETEFTLTNNGTEDVTVEQASTSCGCTTGSVGGVDFGMHQSMRKSVNIPAGQSVPLTAIYDPLAHGPNGTGQITRQLFLKTNSITTPEIEVRVSADVYKNE